MRSPVRRDGFTRNLGEGNKEMKKITSSCMALSEEGKKERRFIGPPEGSALGRGVTWRHVLFSERTCGKRGVRGLPAWR